MSELINTARQAVARRIRSERKARKWTVATLAAQTDLSMDDISKVERGVVSPSARQLVGLAHAFEMTLGGILAPAELYLSAVQHASDQPLWEDPESHYVRRQLFLASNVPIELAKIYLPPKTMVTLPPVALETVREVIYVLGGTMTVTDAGTVHVLEEGDTFGLAKICEVTFENATIRPCIYLVALARK